jgi:hypothetical protein
MTDSTYPATGGFTGVTEAANFIPEIWSDEVIAAYKRNLVLAGLVKKLRFKGKKGDTIHVPSPTRGDAHAKGENTAVTVQGNVEGVLDIAIDQHWEYSRLIEDIADVQAKSSMRRFYTDDAGYALSVQVDNDLWLASQEFGDGTAGDYIHPNSYYNDSTAGLAAYAVDTVTTADVVDDAAVRGMIKLQDDADTPMTGRFWVMPPSMKSTILGIDRYNSRDFTSQRGVQNGYVSNIYGVDFYVSTNAPTVETATANTAGGALRASMLAHSDSIVLVEQMGVRSQAQYKQEWLGTLYTSDMLYGYDCYRPESGFLLIVNT